MFWSFWNKPLASYYVRNIVYGEHSMPHGADDNILDIEYHNNNDDYDDINRDDDDDDYN